MLKLWRLTLGLFVVLVALFDTGQWIGRTFTVLLFALSTNPDGTPCKRPCIFGVRPA